jgi:CcmD family protein
MDSGKLFVVIAVLAVILVGLITYMVFLDRKVTKLEKELKDQNQNRKA